MTLQGSVAIVTGGAKGNGKGIVKALAKDGATVVIFGHAGNMDATTKEMTDQGYDVSSVIVDMRDKAGLKGAVERVVQQKKQIDILVNNAGVMKYEPFTEVTEASRDWQFAVNIIGVWDLTQIVIPYMVEQQYGRIINLSSVTGEYVADPGSVTYATNKAAMIGFTKSLAVEYADQGITVNALCPGWIRTPMVEAYCSEERPEDPESLIYELGQGLPVKRMGNPDDIGNLTAFLAKKESSFITGSCIVIDGGSILPES